MVIMTSYVEKPSLMRSSYDQLLQYFFGSSDKKMKVLPSDPPEIID
jgi:hypothetical protein